MSINERLMYAILVAVDSAKNNCAISSRMITENPVSEVEDYREIRAGGHIWQGLGYAMIGSRPNTPSWNSLLNRTYIAKVQDRTIRVKLVYLTSHSNKPPLTLLKVWNVFLDIFPRNFFHLLTQN